MQHNGNDFNNNQKKNKQLYNNKFGFGIIGNGDINMVDILLLSGNLFREIFKSNKMEVISNIEYIEDNNKKGPYDASIRFIRDIVYLYVCCTNLLQKLNIEKPLEKMHRVFFNSIIKDLKVKRIWRIKNYPDNTDNINFPNSNKEDFKEDFWFIDNINSNSDDLIYKYLALFTLFINYRCCVKIKKIINII